MSIAKIAVDLRSRTFELEVSEEHVDAVLSKIEALFQRYVSEEEAPGGSEPISNSDVKTASTTQARTVEKPPRTRGKGTAKVGWKLVDLTLSSEQIKELREFYNSKGPATQNDSVAVVAAKLKSFLKKEEFSGDEIHSALKLVEQPTPRNLAAVFGNMKRDGIAGADGSTLFANSYLDDYVGFRMKKKADPKNE